MLNGPCILMQLVRLWIQSPLKEALFVDNSAFCVILQLIPTLSMFHRAFGGLGIAIFR